MYFKDFVNGLSEPFRLRSVMDVADITLPHLNQILPQVLPNSQLHPVAPAAASLAVNLSAFALTSKSSVVLLQASRASLRLISSSQTTAAASSSHWLLLCSWEPAEFTENGEQWSLQAGDLLLVRDSCVASLTPRILLNCTVVVLQAHYLAHWKTLFEQTCCRHFRADSGWARLLSVYLRELNEPFMERIASVPSDQGVCLDTVLSLAVMMIGQSAHQRLSSCVPDKKREMRHKLYTEITLWLYMNYGEASLTGKRVAREFGISVRTLHKLFREFNETASFALFLNDIRMQNARNMLRDSLLGHLKVGDIGLLCGFSDPAHFGKVFKKHHAMTPGQMRDIAYGLAQSRT